VRNEQLQRDKLDAIDWVLDPHPIARPDAAGAVTPPYAWRYLLERQVRRAQSAADTVHRPHGVARMKAIALIRYLPIDDPASLIDVELPRPAPGANDLLVRVEAVSVNPVDTKVRSPKPQVEAQPKVLGYDAAGTVEATGTAVDGFQPGDRVYYAGDITRPGSNAQFQLVDARLVGHAPRSINLADAAALPLTVLTAWELLFQRMPFDSEHGGKGKSLLIIGGAGGVGSIAIQLAHRAGFTVIATASRSETSDWCRSLGAQHVINHRQPLQPQLRALGFEHVDAVLNLADTDRYWDVIGEVLAPQGHVGLIVEPAGALKIGDPYKAKAIGIHWEMMFARPRFKTTDQAEQGRILERVATLIDAGALRSTRTETLAPINAANLREAHRRLESGSTIGKLVLAGW
jgi:NADPH2:quinone reductase